MAKLMDFRSSVLSRTDIPGDFALFLGTFGRPARFFIK